MIKRGIKRALAAAGLQVMNDSPPVDPVEFSSADLDVLRYVLENGLTMASRERLVATINACKHAVLSKTDGDFVECGVWRGGNSIAAKLTFENYGSDKQVWLFDTFAGMTAPTEADTSSFSERSTAERFREAQKGTHTDWCYASIDDVRSNLEKAGIDLTGVRLVEGDVRKTLGERENLPERISVLRLDTDFYDSTKVELETLYPRLSIGGSLLIDDFGHWDGARRAVEEYFDTFPPGSRPLLHFTDYTGRMAVKVADETIT